MKIELSKEEQILLQRLAIGYYFGMFQQLGIAQNEEEEYELRDALLNLQKKIEQQQEALEAKWK